MKYIKFLMPVAAVALALLVVSCCPCRKHSSASVSQIKNKTWTLVSMDGNRQAPANNYFIVFGDDGRISGKGDCNRLMGSYELSTAGSINIARLGSTRMFCPDQAKEDRFVGILQEVNGFTIDTRSNMLILLKDDQAVLMFEGAK